MRKSELKGEGNYILGALVSLFGYSELLVTAVICFMQVKKAFWLTSEHLQIFDGFGFL